MRGLILKRLCFNLKIILHKHLIIIYIKQSEWQGISYNFNQTYRVVPENIQKKQARDAKLLKELKEKRDQAKKERAEKRKLIVSNAEKYYKEYQDQEHSLIEAKRKAKAEGNFFVEPEAKVAFVIRTRG